MYYSDTTNKTGIVEDIDFICGTDSTSYPLLDKTRNANRHAYKAFVDVSSVTKRWLYDDSNLGSLPKVDFSMTEATHEVVLPAHLKIRAVEIKDVNGNWNKLQEIDLMELNRTISSADETLGLPTRYALVGNYIYVLCKPTSTSVTLTNGLRLWIEREIDVFLSTDTNQEVGIAEPFHRIVSIGASIDWLMVNDTSKVDKWLARYEQERAELRQFYGSRNVDAPKSLSPNHDTRDYE